MSCLIRLSESCSVDSVDSGKSMVVVFVFLGPSMTAIKIMFEVSDDALAFITVPRK